MLDVLFPFSYVGVCLGFLIGIGLSSVFVGILGASIILICIWLGMIRIMPLVRLCKRVLDALFPDQLSEIQGNIGSSFLIKNPEAIPEGRHIYMWHPHGVFCTSHFFHIGTKFTNWDRGGIRGTALSSLLWLPFMKEFFEELNAVPTDYYSMKRALESGSISVAPGGMREMLHEGSTILSRRRGIFKMALETGTPLVPIVSVNEDSLCSIVEIPWIQKILEPYDMCISIPTLKSAYKLISLLHTPLKDPIISVVGSPLAVDKVEVPSEAQISELRERYIAALKKLYLVEMGKELKII